MMINIKNSLKQLIYFISNSEANLMNFVQQKIDYERMYPLIKISKILTKKYTYYFYFSLIFFQDIYRGLICVIFFNLVRQLNIFLKYRIVQRRPYNRYPDKISFYKKRKETLSFPSQSIQSCLIIYTLIYHYYPYYLVKYYFTFLLTILATTRIYRGLHYPHDILISYLFARLLIKYYLISIYKINN